MRHRVVVGVSGSPGSLTALHRAAAEARERDAELCAVLAWHAPGTGYGGRCSCDPAVFRACREASVERLRAALETAFAVHGPGTALTALAVRGMPGPALVDAVHSPDDLLVVGTGRRGRLLGALRTPVAVHCLAHASCPVLAVPPNPLEAELTAMRRAPWRRLPGPAGKAQL
ncbi:universal stress protein [Streptomyces sp. NPDC060194]|uniref:universal stress protein n=1 Tax=Streptomyces sp. NPDC060194 TaxID=3347069 RepID=UPI0036675212